MATHPGAAVFDYTEMHFVNCLFMFLWSFIYLLGYLLACLFVYLFALFATHIYINLSIFGTYVIYLEFYVSAFCICASLYVSCFSVILVNVNKKGELFFFTMQPRSLGGVQCHGVGTCSQFGVIYEKCHRPPKEFSGTKCFSGCRKSSRQ